MISENGHLFSVVKPKSPKAKEHSGMSFCLVVRCNIPNKCSSSEPSWGKNLLTGGLLLTSVTALTRCGFSQLRSAISSPISKGVKHSPL